MRITNLTKQTLIAAHANLADTFLTRMVGLLKHERLTVSEGLIITHCQQIHMFFMKFAIDVIFIDKNNVVVGLVENILPNKMSPMFFKANRAIELPVGTIVQSQTEVGNILDITHS